LPCQAPCGKKLKLDTSEGNIEDLEHLRAFEDLLYDAVHLLYAAHDVDRERDTDGFKFTYIRSSVLNTLLLFECGANCCIDSLDLPSAFAADLDKLPFLSKYELFLSRINENAFDRGCHEIQAVAELKAIRDSYVHPKVRRSPYEQIAELVWDADFGTTKILGIPRNPREWTCAHAVLALRSANEFFNLFFLTWCGFDPNTVCEMLLSSNEVSIPASSSTYIDCIGGLDRAVKVWAIDFRFIGKVMP
jgi:hypothetical protein